MVGFFWNADIGAEFRAKYPDPSVMKRGKTSPLVMRLGLTLTFKPRTKFIYTNIEYCGKKQERHVFLTRAGLYRHFLGGCLGDKRSMA